jgi:hypothetical protein
MFAALSAVSCTASVSGFFHTFRPSDTNAAMDPPAYSNKAHFAAAPPQATSQPPTLHVFMAGTGAHPHEYTDLLAASANAGFHTIGLEYQSCAQSVGATATWCQDNQPENCACQGDVHAAVVGGGSHPLVNVTAANSVDRRLASALAYLHVRFPSEQWDAFTRTGSGTARGSRRRAAMDVAAPSASATATATAAIAATAAATTATAAAAAAATTAVPSGVVINWARTVVSGHSQGAGHAAWIAKAHAAVRGAVPISGPQDLRPDCSWVANPPGSLTPPFRIVPFAHEREDAIAPMRANWGALRVTTDARPAVGVGSALEPGEWAGAPALLTGVPPAISAGGRPEHCSTALDLFTPKLAGGRGGGGSGGGGGNHEKEKALQQELIGQSPGRARQVTATTKKALYAQEVWAWLLAAAAARDCVGDGVAG